MGDRAVITTSREEDIKESNDIGIYLHWDGDINSVSAFLEYCKLQGFRKPEEDDYGWARLCQIIANYISASEMSRHHGLSIGINKCCKLDCDNYDNGTYIIEDWEIINRKYEPEWCEEYDEDRVKWLIEQIDKAQPEKMRLLIDLHERGNSIGC